MNVWKISQAISTWIQLYIHVYMWLCEQESWYNILVVVLKCGHLFAIKAPVMAGFKGQS